MKYYRDLQDSMPLFVRKPMGITWKGRFYPQGKEFPWKTMGISFEQARVLFYSDQLYHSDELAAESKVGDGLDVLNITQLQDLVNDINDKVKKATGDNKAAFQKKKCKKSTVPQRQRGLIRRWRSNFGELENE